MPIRVTYLCPPPKISHSGVSTTILNNKKQAIIHLATELNKVPVLLILLQFKDRIDVQQGGEHGRTALHIAAIYDFDECARILVSGPARCVLLVSGKLNLRGM